MEKAAIFRLEQAKGEIVVHSPDEYTRTVEFLKSSASEINITVARPTVVRTEVVCYSGPVHNLPEYLTEVRYPSLTPLDKAYMLIEHLLGKVEIGDVLEEIEDAYGNTHTVKDLFDSVRVSAICEDKTA